MAVAAMTEDRLPLGEFETYRAIEIRAGLSREHRRSIRREIDAVLDLQDVSALLEFAGNVKASIEARRLAARRAVEIPIERQSARLLRVGPRDR
jgi:hypothetical protein